MSSLSAQVHLLWKETGDQEAARAPRSPLEGVTQTHAHGDLGSKRESFRLLSTKHV